MARGLILFAHGARDPRWAAPFEAVAERVRLSQPDAAVRLAFLELMPPTLLDAGTALAAVCDEVQILPLFLGAGGHVRKDLPALVDTLRAARPQTRFVLHPPVGELDAVLAAMAAAAVALLAPQNEST